MEARRTNFLRMRLAASAAGIGILAIGLLPWLVLWLVVTGTTGGLTVLLAVLCMGWGLLFIPLLWLATQVLRLAWHPVVEWRPLRRIITTRGTIRPDEPERP